MRIHKIKNKTLKHIEDVQCELKKRIELQQYISLKEYTKNDINYIKRTGKLLDIKKTLKTLITQLDHYY